MMLKIAHIGIVIIQDRIISLRVLRFKAESPFARPTPKIPPTNA
jgi:hypothetical protein